MFRRMLTGAPTGLAPAIAALAMLIPAAGCDPVEPLEGALLLATLDTHHFCDMDAVVSIRLRATWQACADEEPDCEAPGSAVVDGDRYSCPATTDRYDLGVELSHGGRYRMEAVAELSADGPRIECFVDPQTGSTEVQLPGTRLRQASPVVLDEHGPCP